MDRFLLNHRQLHGKKLNNLPQSSKVLVDLFSQYNAKCVFLSLGVSDLWGPNVSSQVKHQFAFGIAASIPVEKYTEDNLINTYEKFVVFIKAVYQALPEFISLEDYIPEDDWGEVKISSGDEYLRIFYGGSVECIPDFIDAFRMVHCDNVKAFNDMNFATTLQNQVIESVELDVLKKADNIRPGYVEVPSEQFWKSCRKALDNACGRIATEFNDISDFLTIDLGNFIPPHEQGDFSEAVMSGRALPAMLIRIGESLVPLSLRNATSAVIDQWHEQDINIGNTFSRHIKWKIECFLRYRIPAKERVGGPVTLKSSCQPISIESLEILVTDKKLYLILVILPEEMQQLENINTSLHNILENKNECLFYFERIKKYAHIVLESGEVLSPDNMELIAIIADVCTSPAMLTPPQINGHIIWLHEFITIFNELQDSNELDRFFRYQESTNNLTPASIVDFFASFRDSHGLLNDGATEFNFIVIDPHWGSIWRFNSLKEFWKIAPSFFPDGNCAWKLEQGLDGIQRLEAKGTPTLAWSTVVQKCTVQSVFELTAQKLDQENGPLLELFVHCLIDSICQHSNIIMNLEIFKYRHLVIVCRADEERFMTRDDEESNKKNASYPALTDCKLETISKDFVSISVKANLSRLCLMLDTASDSSYEAECLIEFIARFSKLISTEVDPQIYDLLEATKIRPPRFYTQVLVRRADVPDYGKAQIPGPENYKLARRDLAVALKRLGVIPSHRYELFEAKSIINSVRDVFRQNIHELISSYDRNLLSVLCIKEHDILIADYQRVLVQIKQSLKHEVSYDRTKILAERREEFVRNARNYRYLLECCLSLKSQGSTKPSSEIIIQIIALIDWLFVLYNASDTLHNEIDVGGIEIDYNFVPIVYFSEDSESKQQEYSLHMAQVNLGIDLIGSDEVSFSLANDLNLMNIDDAFKNDLGFRFSNLLQALILLTEWLKFGGTQELKFGYVADAATIINIFVQGMDNVSPSTAQRILNFLTLDPVYICRLIGKDVDEEDVPIWEHTKRSHRYVIRPVISLGNDLYGWGAATTERSFANWTGTISNGYLPAKFEWPAVQERVKKIKTKIEKTLEEQAYTICSRVAPCTIKNIDFKRRFSQESFEDVGDFDVLAYWPEINYWLAVECKYNQPPYCLKDARRLRDRIFGADTDRGQFMKIERRRAFLFEHLDHLRQLLAWPPPLGDSTPTVKDIYVSRDIYWWMVNPPYAVPTEFVRIDALDNWLRSSIFNIK